MFNLADQVDQVAVIDVNVYNGEGVAEFFVRVLLDGKLDGSISISLFAQWNLPIQRNPVTRLLL